MERLLMTFSSRFALPGTTSRRLAMAAVVCLPLLGGCNKHKTEQAPPPEVEISQVVMKDVPLTREWVGTTDGMVNAAIRPKVQGYLKARIYTEGTRVKTGDLLFTIDDRQYQAALDQAKGNLAQAQANLGKSRLDVQKYTPLVKEGAVSQQEYDNAVQTNQANQAAVQAAKAAVDQAALNLSWTHVRSPITGVAGIAVTNVGDLVDTSTQLTTVSDIDPIKVTFPLSESEFLWFRRAVIQAKKEAEQAAKTAPATTPKLTKSTPAPARAEEDEILTLTLSDGSTYEHKGKLAVADREIDPKTGTILVYGVFPNPDKLLRPGQFAKVKANVTMIKSVVLVPQKAIMEVQDALMAMVVGKDNKAEVRPVKCGDTFEDMRIVKEGLRAGENVVVEGLLKVRNGMTVAPKPAAPTSKSAPAPSTPER